MKKFQKPLTLVFEVILQPPKHTFENGYFFCILAHCALQLKLLWIFSSENRSKILKFTCNKYPISSHRT